MRTVAEIRYRIAQELLNFWSWARPPEPNFPVGFAPRRFPPNPQEVVTALAGSASAAEVIDLAEEIRRHRFPLLGLVIETGPEIRWRRDYLRSIETGLDYFRNIPYLDANSAGDHKVIWELNRHQHLVVLAQAYLFTRDEANIAEICSQLESWLQQNPFARGINWASALEVAFRALSWMWVYQFVGDKLPSKLRGTLLCELYRHASYLANNLSFYFSPNTHLLGEALVLHASGLFFSSLPEATEWEARGARIMQEQIERQVSDDGSHFEQSTYYHLYALDMFVLHATLAKPDRLYMDRLRNMARYLDAILGPARALPFIGDDDGGRLFHPYGDRANFGRATMATATIVLNLHNAENGQWSSEFFRDAAMVMVAGENQIIVKAGGFGPWGAGHSHADVLSIIARSGDREILIDPGTYTYVGDAYWRDWFRGTSAHNTIRIDGLDQAVAAGPFRWKDRPQVTVLCAQTGNQRDIFEAECRYSGFTHRRRVEFQKPDVVTVLDEISGPPGEHTVEQFWHLGSDEARACLILADGEETVEGWRSSVFGEKHPAPVVRVTRRGPLPLRLEARISL